MYTILDMIDVLKIPFSLSKYLLNKIMSWIHNQLLTEFKYKFIRLKILTKEAQILQSQEKSDLS